MLAFPASRLGEAGAASGNYMTSWNDGAQKAPVPHGVRYFLGTDQITHVSLQATSPHYCLRLTLCQSILVSRHLQCPLNGVWINVLFNAPKCCKMTSTWRDLELKKGASVYQSGNATAYSMQSTSTISPNGSGRHPRMPLPVNLPKHRIWMGKQSSLLPRTCSFS
jgi:hypothetical protein